MRALVTGITGFAGGHLAEHLLDAGDEVLGCARRSAWAADTPRALSAIPLVTWDLAAPDNLSDRARAQIAEFAPEAIYHLAALSVPDDCGRGEPTRGAQRVNVDAAVEVVELAASLRSRPRVLFTSSSHVYAQVSPERPAVDEASPLGAKNAYGHTKRAAEEQMLARSRARKVDLIVVRAFQHTGPRQDGRMMLPEWARQLATAGADAIRVQTCDAWIDLSDVRDVVRAYRLLVERGEAGAVYNVGSGVRRRSGDLLAQLCALARVEPRVVETRPGIKQDPIAEIGRLRACTGWEAAVPLDQTMVDTLEDWRARGSRCQSEPVR